MNIDNFSFSSNFPTKLTSIFNGVEHHVLNIFQKYLYFYFWWNFLYLYALVPEAGYNALSIVYNNIYLMLSN